MVGGLTAGTAPAIASLLRDAIPEQRRTAAFTAVGMAASIGFACGPFAASTWGQRVGVALAAALEKHRPAPWSERITRPRAWRLLWE